MQYDLPVILELCGELGFASYKVSDTEIEISLGEELTLCFQNISDDDCLIGFKGTPSHSHGNVDFAGQGGYGIDVHYLDVLTGLDSRKLLICERWSGDVLTDRYLIHASCNDEFGYMENGDRIVVKTAEHSLSKSP